MMEFTYLSNNGYAPFKLYKLEEGSEIFVKEFDFRDDMLKFIEQNWDKSKLYINI